MYLFRLVHLVVDNKHGRGDGVVRVDNWHNVQTYQLGEGAEEVLAGLLIIEVRFGDQHLEVSKERDSEVEQTLESVFFLPCE